MGDIKLIGRIQMDCPICDRVHEVEERSRINTVTIKGDKINYEEHYYYCANADEEESEFASGGMVNQNLMNARDAYRRKHNLLTFD